MAVPLPVSLLTQPVRLAPDQQQLTLLALATLALDRPGWLGACRAAAVEFVDGPRLFAEFYALNRDRWHDRWGGGLPRSTPPVEEVTSRVRAR
jgi:hypothetical protein